MSYTIPNQLKKAIEQNKLIIFLGAGVSASAGLPLWKDIVCKTLENPDVFRGLDYKDALEKDLFTPLEVLDKIKEQNKKLFIIHLRQKPIQPRRLKYTPS